MSSLIQCIVKRRVEFSASHRYWLPEHSASENQDLFGKGCRFPGHGHNYVLFVAMHGDIQPNGMVISFAEAKQIIHQKIIEHLDQSYLNHVWPEFEHTLPTTEYLAHCIWHRLVPHLPLAEIQLFEHPKLWATYTGDYMQATLTIGTHFSAAHRLASLSLDEAENLTLYGKCARPHGHGHNYHLEVTVQGKIHPRTGMLVDLSAFQQVVDQQIVEPLDHTFLNLDVPYFSTVIPTAENIAAYIATTLAEPIQALGVTLHRIKLIESPNNSCEILCSQLVSERQERTQQTTIPALVF